MAQRIDFHRGLLAGMAALLWLSAAVRAAEPVAASDTLAWVNDEAVTVADLDALLLASHRTRDMSSMRGEDLPNFLKKAVNDRLLVQDAVAMGMDSDEELRGKADDFLAGEAMRAFVDSAFDPPVRADSFAVRGYFRKYYWKILLRQVSLRRREEADSLRAVVLGGADMDSLARARSVDSHRLSGGLHHLKYWGDVENVLRDAVVDTETGELSEVFPYHDAFAFLRVEKRTPIDEEAFDGLKAKIASIVLGRERDEAFSSFLDSLEGVTPLRTNEEALGEIRSDAGMVFKGEFLREQSDTALSVEGGGALTGTELRGEISHTAMVVGTAPFDSIVHLALDRARSRLLLGVHARASGFFEDPELLERRRRKWDQILIERYLQEIIASRIVFNHAEFQDYYDANPDRFRGGDQVKLDLVLFENRDEADQMVSRLESGADFDFLRKRYQGEADQGQGSRRWASEDSFSNAIRKELGGMQIGDTSGSLETGGGWMIFKLLGRRKGAVKALDEVEMQIREVMFQKKFNELLDEHLRRLKDRSKIRMNQEAIDEYFGQGS